MAMTAFSGTSTIRPWIVAMAMLGSLFFATRWTEILSARFEFQPVLPSYTALCEKASDHDNMTIVKTLCRHSRNEQSANY